MKKLFYLLLVFCFEMAFAQNPFSSNRDKAAEKMDREEYKEAIGYFDKALSFKNDAPNKYKIADAYLYRGYCKLKQHDIKSALKDMDEALAIKPEYIKCYNMKASVYLENNDFENCLLWCNKGLELNSLNEELLVNKSAACRSLKKYAEARASLHVLLKENPRNTSALRFLGATSLKQHQWDSAVFYFSKVLDIEPLDAGSLFDRGISKSYLNQFDGAEIDIKKAMEIDTASKYIGYNNLGFFLKLEQKDYTGALAFFNKAIELHPDFAYAYSNRGFTKLQLGDVDGAFKDLKHSIKLDPTNSYAFKNLGLVYLKDNNKKKACSNLQQAFNLGYTEAYDDEVETLMKNNCK